MGSEAVESPQAPLIRLLGVPVHVVTLEDVVAKMEWWIAARDRARWIAVTNSHGIVEAARRPEFLRVLKSADLSIPDGYRVGRLARWRGYGWAQQVTGPELLTAFSRVAAAKGYRCYFYGDTEEVL